MQAKTLLEGALFRPASGMYAGEWRFAGTLIAGRVGDGIGHIGGIAVVLFAEWSKDMPGDIRFACEGERWQSRDKGPSFVLVGGGWEIIPLAK